MNPLITEFRKKLKKRLSEYRYEHTLSVSYTCVCLAMRYGYDLEKAEIAGLLHDCAKCYDEDTYVRRCEKHGIPLSAEEKAAPAVLHAKLGAWMAKEHFGITDGEILSAIACHTTGKPDMGLLDKILYIADYIEVRRDKAPDLPLIRRLAFEDLDEALYRTVRGTLDHLATKNIKTDPMTQKTYDFLENERRKRDARGECRNEDRNENRNEYRNEDRKE